MQKPEIIQYENNPAIIKVLFSVRFKLFLDSGCYITSNESGHIM